MHETVLKYGLVYHTQPVAQVHKRHDLRLQVGRETRIGMGFDINASYITCPLDMNPVFPLFDRKSCCS